MAIFLFILLSAVWYFRPTGPETLDLPGDRPTSRERLQLDFSNDDWHLVREQQQSNKIHRQYIHGGETTENWTELVSIDTFPGLQEQGNPEEFASLMEKSIREWGGDKVFWNVIRKSPTDLVYEWQTAGREGTPDQHSLGRIVLGKEGLHLAVYAKKTSALNPEQRAEWLQHLDAAILVESVD